MKITKRQLRGIIRESIEEVMNEGEPEWKGPGASWDEMVALRAMELFGIEKWMQPISLMAQADKQDGTNHIEAGKITRKELIDIVRRKYMSDRDQRSGEMYAHQYTLAPWWYQSGGKCPHSIACNKGKWSAIGGSVDTFIVNPDLERPDWHRGSGDPKYYMHGEEKEKEKRTVFGTEGGAAVARLRRKREAPVTNVAPKPKPPWEQFEEPG